MNLPDFYQQAPTITVRDPLAHLLGAAEHGLLTYTYRDAVLLAGHSCPTVAGTWLMLRAALEALYPGETPERGALQVAFAQDASQGVTGVMASVARLVTGAASEDGFHGLAGRFDRRGLLDFGVGGAGLLRVTRVDTQDAVDVSLNLAPVPVDEELGALMPLVLTARASPAQRQAFRQAWQARVRALLLDFAEDARVVQVRRAADAGAGASTRTWG